MADEFKVFSGMGDLSVVDPKRISPPRPWSTLRPVCIIPPNSFALARSLVQCMPAVYSVLCLWESTYARCGIVTNFTPLEPGWHRYARRISNPHPLPARSSNEGIAQFSSLKVATPA